MNTIQRFGIGSLAAIAMFAGLTALPAWAGPASQPSRAAADAEFAERAKWENVITFFGEEDSGRYSIRILDKSVTEPANFKYLELWIYDLTEKKWLKVDDRTQETRIVLPKDKPQDAPDGNQLLAEIPVDQEKIGLYYCKWQVNGVEGGTLTRIGPGHVGKPVDLGKIPPGMIVTDVPLDKSHGERMIVPNPRTHTGETGK
jgi:hypothetical protein